MLLLPAVASGQPLVNKIHHCDVMVLLRALPDNCINCVVTSPPYFGLRDYQTPGQIGLEPTPSQFVQTMVTVFREVRRILRDDGVCWLNLGDSYSTHNSGDKNHVHNGYDPVVAAEQGIAQAKLPAQSLGFRTEKQLMGIPWRVAFALQDDGWVLRSDIVWEKGTCMPESVQDRPTRSHEYVFLLTKSQRYFYDSEAIREPAKEESLQRLVRGVSDQHKNIAVPGKQTNSLHKPREHGDSYKGRMTRNKRSVWHVNPEPFKDSHFAVFPTKLIEPMILAGCPAQVCSVCGAPWEREVEVGEPMRSGGLGGNSVSSAYGPMDRGGHGQWDKGHMLTTSPKTTIGFKPTCDCNASTRPGLVLDPFMGSGTTALVARKLGRSYLGCDLNESYVAMAKDRLRLPFEEKMVKRETRLDDLPLFAAR